MPEHAVNLPQEEDAAILGPDADKGWGVGPIGGVFAGMGQSGFLFEMGMLTSSIVIVIFAAVGGYLVGRTAKARVAFTLPFVVMNIGIAIATWWYTADRSSIVNYELVIPMAMGCLPGIGIYFVVKKALLRAVA
jgi:hypothetical protein